MTEADKVVFLNAVEQKEFEPEFTSKKWAYTIDQQSVAGNYNSQLQFNIGNLASSGLWCDLREAIVRFPVAITIKDTGTSSHDLAAMTSMAATIKGSFYSMVNSMQFTIGSTTVQSHMPYLNSAVHFDMLTKWSIEEYQKWKDPLAFGIDDCVFTKDSSTFLGLANDTSANLAPAQGFTLPATSNRAFQDRAYNLNNSKAATTFKTKINPNGATQGEGQYAAYAVSASTNAGIVWAATYMATLRLKDLCPALNEMPPMKNARGFVYIAYQSATTTFNASTASPPVLSSITNSTRYGNTQPLMLGTLASPTVASSFECTCDVSGATITLGDGTTKVSPAFAAARLYAPLIEAVPEIDKALTLTKKIRYTDRILTTVDLPTGSSISSVVSAGVVNPKRITILPIISGAGTSTITTFQNPAERSPFEPCPMASSPFASLKNVQVLVGGKPILQTPTLYSFENFQHEIANEMGEMGGQSVIESSGLLTQRQWEQLYRYYTYNLGRRLQSQDGSAVSVTLSCSNDCTCDLRLLVWVDYERECVVDTAIGDVKQLF